MIIWTNVLFVLFSNLTKMIWQWWLRIFRNIPYSKIWKICFVTYRMFHLENMIFQIGYVHIPTISKNMPYSTCQNFTYSKIFRITYSEICHIPKYAIFQNMENRFCELWNNVSFQNMPYSILKNIPYSKIFHIPKYSIFHNIPYFLNIPYSKIFHIPKYSIIQNMEDRSYVWVI